ncbi:MAG: beta-lactamase family protein [Chloroflexi bacterium]|nr:beta-lactamase family protein [Chloroflexota bacterium]
MSDLAAVLREADAVADRFLEGRHVPGVAYGIVAGGELVHGRGIGTLRVGEAAPPDIDSVFRIASMTKSFTAATVLTLRDEGRLALDDPIGRHVPEVADLRGPTADSPPITVRHLLTMSAGLATDDPWGDRQQGLDLDSFSALLRGPLTFAWPPGTRFEYSNLGYGILGRLITNVAGAEYRDAVRKRLLEPLQMTSTGYLREEVPAARLALGYLWRDGGYVAEPMDPYGALAAMGGLFTSVRDLARWVAFLADAYPPRDDAEAGMPLSRADRREMQTAQGSWAPTLTLRVDGEPEVASGGYGFGLFCEDDSRLGRLVRHGGGYPGFGSHMIWQPASGLGVITLTNHRYGPAAGLARALLRTLVDHGAAPARRLRPAPATEAARRDVERLLESWDDELAGRAFAMNVELDEPLERRRADLARIRERHGPLRPDPARPPTSDTPLHLAWSMAGENGGSVDLEILLSPESPPRIQALDVTSVPVPAAQVQAVAAAVIATLNGADPDVPGELTLDPGLGRPALVRALRIVAARHAPVRLGRVMASDGEGTATWRLDGDRGSLDLAVATDPATGIVTSIVLTPRSPELPPHGD